MRTIIIKQEILLVITAFSQKELCEKNAIQNFHSPTQPEELEAACWNGLSDELLAGIVEQTSCGKRLCIWSIHSGKSVLEIELCNSPQVTAKHLSVDPYIFLPVMLQN